MGAAVRSGVGAAWWLSRAIGVLVGLLLIWLTLRVGLASFYADTDPSRAARWTPGDARVLGALAEKALVPGAGPFGLARAQDLATAAIRRDPTIARAARTLGLVADLRGNHARALRLMNYAQGLSRRDLPTQLWLSQKAVARNDVPDALRHYDIALKTWAGSQAVIFPVLISATGDSRLMEPLADMVAHADIWRDSFLVSAMQSGPSVENLVMLSRALARRRAPLADSQRTILLARLVTEGKYALAKAVYNAAQPKGAAARPGIIDGNFEEAPRFPPFDWSFADQSDLHAERVRSDDGKGRMLSFAGENGMGGTVAKQLLGLPPGNYRFSARAGSISQTSPISRPRWQLECAEAGGATILNLVFPAADERGRGFTTDFHIPKSRCEAQWLSLLTPGDSDLQPQEPAWVDDVAIKPIG